MRTILVWHLDILFYSILTSQCILKIKRFYTRLENIFFLQFFEKMWWKCKSISAVSFLHSLLYIYFFIYIFLITKLVYPIQITTSLILSHVFATIKSNLFLCLFFLAYIPIIAYHSPGVPCKIKWGVESMIKGQLKCTI